MHMEKKTTVPDFSTSDMIVCTILSVVFIVLLFVGATK
jgi:hypothetical protein